MCKKISQATSAQTTWRPLEVEVRELNQMLSGWANYFRLGYVTEAWRIVQQHACRRLRQWMHRKTNTRRGGP
ncbi:MAG TPA: group II intron maturase-specific domain-containing protein [Planctomycetaceae bacterium]|nr:group II intron maturase-specific domain-containing protein [Planctomycetaceae bacterium]